MRSKPCVSHGAGQPLEPLRRRRLDARIEDYTGSRAKVLSQRSRWRAAREPFPESRDRAGPAHQSWSEADATFQDVVHAVERVARAHGCVIGRTTIGEHETARGAGKIPGQGVVHCCCNGTDRARVVEARQRDDDVGVRDAASASRRWSSNQ